MELLQAQKELRSRILETLVNTGTGHLGGSLSALGFISVLYSHETRDFHFVLSKAHASLALYSVLDKIYPEIDLATNYGKNSKVGKLHGHVSKKVSPSVALSCGSLGHGLPFAVGLAYSCQFSSDHVKPVICMIGDGEAQEGSTWESLLLLQKFANTKILVVIDNNRSQLSYNGCQVDFVLQLFKSMSLPSMRINGHNLDSIRKALDQFYTSSRPMLLILETIKGYGIPSIHGLEQWHAGKPNIDQYEQFRKEIASFPEEIAAS